MKIVVCIDKSNGMLFNGRRQSQDSVLRARILELSSNEKLWMSPYSAKQFDVNAQIEIDAEYQKRAGKDDFCFVEDKEITSENVESFYIFNWNRKYPADLFFSVDLKAEGFKKIKKEEFKGNSHDKITLEIYSR